MCAHAHTHTCEFYAHTSTAMCTGTRPHFHVHTGMVPRNLVSPSLYTHESPAHGTHVHHTWQRTHTSSPRFPLPGSEPRGSGPGGRAGVSARAVPFRARAGRPPGAPSLPPPGRPGGAGNYAAPGFPLTTRLSSRPRPTRAQTLITASRPVISRGRGRTRRPAGPTRRGGQRGRCGSKKAPPPSPWQRRRSPGGGLRRAPGEGRLVSVQTGTCGLSPVPPGRR